MASGRSARGAVGAALVLIASVPVFGWWAQRRTPKTLDTGFSVIVSVFGPGVYAAIKPMIEAQSLVSVEV